MCLACGFSLYAITRTVAQNGTGAFKTIQAAINASAPGDVVEIIDAATYPEQVTIDSTKNELTLTSSNPTALNKPRVVWQDLVHVHPATVAEAKIDSMINFDQNGALRILGAKNVTINGIAVDGGGPYVYGYGCVWTSTSSPPADLVAGNAALTIWVSGGAHITNCDVSNAYWGINFKDRNEGGIFANANPADLQPQNIVPMSGFGRTGNHIIEYNRIHNNSFGLYFESSWDLGSTIRYNLIYENHHQTAAFAKTVSTMPTGNNCGGDGKNQPGGAMMFKDVAYSPLSIYNNTFWHNFMIFIGGWRPGAQHLIFNNIFAKPFEYWASDPTFSNDAYMELSPYFPNRMYNCIYTAQIQAPSQYYVSIMNGMPQPQPITQGSLLSTATANAPYPVAANIRWIEMDSTMFLSMDPATANFLTPNWNNTLVAQYIKNQGWQKSVVGVMTGVVKNMDGSVADIGAISSDGNRPTDLASIRPLDPVTMLTPTSATIKFSIDQLIGQFQNPTAKLFRFVSNLPPVANWDPAAVITTANINDITLPAAPVLQVGVNVYTVTVPVAQTADYAFFEGIFEGTDVNGKKYTSSTGFLPYRNLNYKFIVQIWNYALTKQLDTVNAGDTVILKVIPQTKAGGLFTNQINPVSVSLASGYTLGNTMLNPIKALAYPQGITAQTSTGVNNPVMFTKVPTGGIEIVSLSGIWMAATDTEVFQGSTSIRVLPGPPATVLFQDPPSKTYAVPVPPTLPQGSQYPGFLYVYDKYGNKTNAPATITLSSLTPTQGTFVGGNPDLTITTNDTGTGLFSVAAASGATTGSPVRLQAVFSATNDTDLAIMIVGQPVGELFIFYGDTNQYNAATQLNGQVGDYLPVTIIATKATAPASLNDIDTGINVTFNVSGTAGLAFYSSPGASSPTATYSLVHGRVTVWVSSASDSINNGQMTATTTTIGNSSRQNIYITRPLVAIDSAFYYSRTGFGMVDSVSIYYKVKLTMIPDSITLYWPGADSTGKRVVPAAQMTLFPDSQHLTIVLAQPFPAGITAATTTSKQGISYNRPNAGAQESVSSFAISDRVGPLINSAQVVERDASTTGIDTLYVTFSEPVRTASLTGNALILIKNGVPSELAITNTDSISTTRFKLTVVSTIAPPQLGDSLRIDPTGPIADVFGNTANMLNRPVVITQKPIPAAIVQAYYLDKNADGVVDAVRIIFKKSVSLNDLSISLTWGDLNPAYADSIPTGRLSYFGSDSLGIEINVAGAFKTISADSIKTSGHMQATVSFNSMPENPAEATDVADSAAPVIMSAQYMPSADPKGTDTLSVVFSESVAPISYTTPFKLFSKSSGASYYFTLRDTMSSASITHGFLVSHIQGVNFPNTGDSIWIDTASNISDLGSVFQKNAGNRRALLNVKSIPYMPHIAIVRNPFSIGAQVSDGGVTGTGTIIEVPPPLRMADTTHLLKSGTIAIFDILGNKVLKETPFTLSNNWLYYNWDGRNFNGRYVGSGVYVAIITVTQNDGTVISSKKTIGVKHRDGL